MATHLAPSSVDAVVLDLGISSPQVDTAERGFSFAKDGPLDMRMGESGPTAADIIHTYSEKALADILYQLGEESHARRIAAAICAHRLHTPITTTLALAAVIHRALGRTTNKNGTNAATKSFQALRLHVNQELEMLAQGLEAAHTILKPGGTLAVVSFHSLEDRMVKRFLKPPSQQNRHLPVAETVQPSFKLLQTRAQQAKEEEITRNPRARSARLRWGIKAHETL